MGGGGGVGRVKKGVNLVICRYTRCREGQFSALQGPVSLKPRKLFGPVKPLQNLEPCEYRAVLFTYSKDEGRLPSYKKFRAYTLLRF